VKRHTKRCRGVNERSSNVYVIENGTQRMHSMFWDECATCGTWLPLGPSDETPVAVEVRAAEIVADGGDCALMSFDEFGGWHCDWLTYPDSKSEWDAGDLARVIYDHDRDQGAP